MTNHQPPETVTAVPLNDIPHSSDQTELAQLRRERLHDYYCRALHQSDPSRAMLRLISGGLMEIAMHYEERINNILASSPDGLQTLQVVSPALQATVQLAKRIEQLAKLDLQLAQARKPKGRGGQREAA